MPDPTLQGTALRYAAGDLSPAAAEAFEASLADDQDARDALAEAVRLSAAAVGQAPPAPTPSFRGALRARLLLRAGRGQPFAWVALGAASAAVCALLGLSIADRGPPVSLPVARAPVEGLPAPRAPELNAVTAAPMPREVSAPVAADAPADDARSVAEIWADLSTPDHVERAHDDERRWRQHVRDLSHPQHAWTPKAIDGTDGPQP
jgi:hypothetical protein